LAEWRMRFCGCTDWTRLLPDYAIRGVVIEKSL
jgi:hypothetical protein